MPGAGHRPALLQPVEGSEDFGEGEAEPSQLGSGHMAMGGVDRELS